MADDLMAGILGGIVGGTSALSKGLEENQKSLRERLRDEANFARQKSLAEFQAGLQEKASIASDARKLSGDKEMAGVQFENQKGILESKNKMGMSQAKLDEIKAAADPANMSARDKEELALKQKEWAQMTPAQKRQLEIAQQNADTDAFYKTGLLDVAKNKPSKTAAMEEKNKITATNGLAQIAKAAKLKDNDPIPGAYLDAWNSYRAVLGLPKQERYVAEEGIFSDDIEMRNVGDSPPNGAASYDRIKRLMDIGRSLQKK